MNVGRNISMKLLHVEMIGSCGSRVVVAVVVVVVMRVVMIVAYGGW